MRTVYAVADKGADCEQVREETLWMEKSSHMRLGAEVIRQTSLITKIGLKSMK